MSTRVAVQNTIRRVNDIENDLKKRQNVLKESEESKTWWEGEAVRSVEFCFLEIENNLNKIYRNISSLKTQLRNLASDIKHAEDERRRKLELERKKREQMKSNNLV